jgi:hypothetical protein
LFNLDDLLLLAMMGLRLPSSASLFFSSLFTSFYRMRDPIMTGDGYEQREDKARRRLGSVAGTGKGITDSEKASTGLRSQS